MQHIIEQFDFELASLNSTDNIEVDKNHREQVLFPNVVAKNTFIPPTFKSFFIEPGLKNKYSYIARVPANTEVLLFHSWFKYLDGKRSHVAEITKKVPVV